MVVLGLPSKGMLNRGFPQLHAAPRRPHVIPVSALACHTEPRAEPLEYRLSQIATHMKVLGVGLAAFGLISMAPAHAGVVLKKAETRKVFQAEPTTEAPASVAAVAKKPSSGGGFSLPSIGINTGTVAIPAAVLGLGGLAAIGFTVDKDLKRVIEGTIIKDSTEYAGYENVLKSDNGKAPPPAKSSKPAGKAKAAKAAPKPIVGGIPLIFGKK